MTNLFGYSVEIDTRLTKDWYIQSKGWNCDCGHCRNFMKIANGSILTEKNKGTSLEWGEVRCCHELYPYGAPDFPSPHFDLEFWVKLPWILEEPLT